MSRIVASPYTIGGIADDTVMPANAAIQIQVNSVVIRANGSLLITSSGWSTSANSRTNGLPISTLAERDQEDPGIAQRLHPLLHERLAHRERQDRQHQKGSDGADFERAPGVPFTRPMTNDATATARATSTAVSNGTLPTSTQ